MLEQQPAIAIVFPGQGSQSVGMLSGYDHPIITATVAEVSDAINCDLATIIENDAEALNQTINTQPAMLAMGVGVYRAIGTQLSQTAQIVGCAGHSLGEYSALVCAGALSLGEAAVLVRRRAELMQNAVADGGMAAILGLSATQVEQHCTELRQQGESVWAANYNSENQIVIAGKRTSVERASEVLKTAGAKRYVLLAMSVPSHCPLLADAAAELLPALTAVAWQPTAFPVLHSAVVADDNSGTPLPAQYLAAQLTQAINWQQLLNGLQALGAGSVIESGPGKVLTGLGKKSTLPHSAIANAESLAAFLA